jgi:hypothetical protein
MYKDWMKMMVKINVTGPLAKTASSFIGNMFSSGGGGYDGTATFQGYQNAMSSASVAHTGGIVGSSISRTRQVPSSIFDNAPRLHNGLTSDEYPAILQRGEEVVPKNEVNKKTDTPKKVRVEIYNESGQEMQVTESKAQFDAQGTIVKLWLDAYKRNKGGLRNALTG